MKKCEKCSCEFDDSLAVCPDCGAKQTKKKKLGKKAFLIICTLICVVALAGLIVYNYVMNTLIPSQLYEQIDALIEEERFAEARGIARDVPLKISEELENYVINEAYARVQALISDGELKAARKALTDFKVFDEEAKNELAQLILEKCNHELVLMDRGIATCLEEGFELNGCPSCGYEEKITIEKLQHKYDYKETLAPTCEKEGQKEAVCSLCGTKDTKAIEATGHTWGEEKVTKRATCVEKGTKSQTCTVCAKVSESEIAATGVHDYKESITTAATCSKKGVKTSTCSMCKDSFTKDIPATGVHSYNETVTKAATCGSKGSKSLTCTGCAKTSTQEIPATGQHNLTNVTVGSVSCSSYVDYQTKCTVCGTVTNSWSEWVEHSYSEATCTSGGTCKNCGRDRGSWYSLGHDYNNATCTVAKTCKRCGEKSGDPLGHYWQEATPEAPKTCKRCSLTEGSAVPALNIYIKNPLPMTITEYSYYYDYNANKVQEEHHCQITKVEINKSYSIYDKAYDFYFTVYFERSETGYGTSKSVKYNLYNSSGNIVITGYVYYNFYKSTLSDSDFEDPWDDLPPGNYYLEFEA